MDALRKALTENAGIKLVSLLLAVALWLFVTAKGKMEVPLTVPIELQGIPADAVVVGDVPRFLDVRLQGPERLLRRIAEDRNVVCVLDLSLTRPGENMLRISPDDIRRPTGITVTYLSRYEVQVRLDTLLRRTLRLVPVLHGSPAPGYRVVEAAALPPRVTAEGPASLLRTLAEVRTMPLDIQGATRTVTLEPRIDTQGRPIKLLDPDVHVRIEIRKAGR